MASKINLSRHWEHISSDTYDIPKPALAPGEIASAAAKEKDLYRDTDSARDRRGYARKYMQGQGLAFLGMGLGTNEVTALRSITPMHIKKEHERARANTPSKIIPGLRKVRHERDRLELGRKRVVLGRGEMGKARERSQREIFCTCNEKC